MCCGSSLELAAGLVNSGGVKRNDVARGIGHGRGRDVGGDNVLTLDRGIHVDGGVGKGNSGQSKDGGDELHFDWFLSSMSMSRETKGSKIMSTGDEQMKICRLEEEEEEEGK